MRRSEIYIEAARSVAENENCSACIAISRTTESIGLSYWNSARDMFFNQFLVPENTFGEITKQNQLARTIALLLMAEIAKDGELKRV